MNNLEMIWLSIIDKNFWKDILSSLVTGIRWRLILAWLFGCYPIIVGVGVADFRSRALLEVFGFIAVLASMSFAQDDGRNFRG